MIRSFKYRLYPTSSQERRLNGWLDDTRWLYNAALEERQDAYRKRKPVSCIDQINEIPGLREIWPELNQISVHVVRGTLRRIDKAFANFFRRCKTSEKPGYPRFKGKSRWNSLLIDDIPNNKHPIVSGGRRIQIPMIGKIKLKLHRPVEGKPKAMRIKRDGVRHWWVIIVCENVEPKPLSKTDKTVGVDLGLHHFAITSDGDIYKNRRPLAEARLLLERAQRRVSRRKKNSKRRKQTVRLLAKKHVRVSNLRREMHIQIARDLVLKYDTIFVEALNISGLAKGRLAKSVNDVAWGNFLKWLRVKAESAGREVVEVDPYNTSQICSGCGVLVKKGLDVRIHKCPDCGLEIDRDINAARNIKRLGESLRGVATLVKVQRGSAKPKSQQKLDRTNVA